MAGVAHRAIGPHIGQPSHPGDRGRHGRVVQDEPQGSASVVDAGTMAFSRSTRGSVASSCSGVK